MTGWACSQCGWTFPVPTLLTDQDALRRQRAHEEFEAGVAAEAVLKIGRRHGELVKVDADAAKAIEALIGSHLRDRAVSVDYARPRPERPAA